MRSPSSPRALALIVLVVVLGVLPAGAVVETPVQLQDLHPTLLELAGIEEGPSGSLRPVVAGDRGGRFTEDWKLYREGPDALILGSDGTVELYDVGADPQMSTDPAPDRAERVRELPSAPKPRSPNPIGVRPGWNSHRR